jgi:hypothetical protein
VSLAVAPERQDATRFGQRMGSDSNIGQALPRSTLSYTRPMWIWPSDHVVLRSASEPSVLLERISNQTNPQYLLDTKTSPTDRPYEGWIEDGAFRIRPAWPGGRHSFRVYIEGQVETVGTGSRLRARIHLDWGALVFFVVIALMAACAALLRPVIVGVAGPSLVFWLLYFVFGSLAYLMLMAAYWAGAGGARSFLSAVAAGPEASRTSRSLRPPPSP